MSALLFAAQSGWGKSYHGQAWMESNADAYEGMVVMDYCGEYRGLVKYGLAQHWIVGPAERNLSVSGWVDVLASNPKLVLERHNSLTAEEWREVCDRVAEAARRLDRDQLVVVDEAHFVVPQQGKLPDALKSIATTGRGAGTSSMWITQRLAEIDKTITTQCQSRMLGGFKGGDLGSVSVEYPEDVHDPAKNPSPANLPRELVPSDPERPTSLQKFKDDDGHTIGSEWIYSDDSGEIRRINTQNVTMHSTHYGSQGNDLQPPEYTA
ncbi:type IV secretory system conjugative DNA transfer family protein [Haloarcula pellucida]|uniref:Uncharacterized protein n=1 Tax=Haloarcula pellucida TaxID=1427151 RepID=A0A830GMR2_9EURY|nr:type IV secretory system conjugative DNA transfer family protein [Halomicroarcula pellucida]GGN97659.1 hypothetical protein GCM10009030_27150 [Halomicroarcula pellucida]